MISTTLKCSNRPSIFSEESLTWIASLNRACAMRKPSAIDTRNDASAILGKSILGLCYEIGDDQSIVHEIKLRERELELE